MNMISTDLTEQLHDARGKVETYCQSLVDSGAARWWVNEAGYTELHMEGGQAYLFGEYGVTRLK